MVNRNYFRYFSMKGNAIQANIDVAPSETTTELEARVQVRFGARIRDFRLVLLENGLILRGRAKSFHVKQLAQHAVMQSAGLPILANEIEVS